MGREKPGVLGRWAIKTGQFSGIIVFSGQSGWWGVG